jgi:hypothetical protein
MKTLQKRVHMTPDDAEKAVRLLSIIYANVIDTNARQSNQLPFTRTSGGVIAFCTQIERQLSLPENQDLIEWAHKNVADLF